MRVGIDVGGTNTDAVLLERTAVIGKIKTQTTQDVTSGIVTAVERLLGATGIDRASISAVMIGTTHFTNAVIERRRLTPTAIVRLGLPATQAVEPFEDWPDDLRTAIGGHGFIVHGGNEFDGRPLSALDATELRQVARELRRRGVEAVAVTAVFSPMTSEMEERAAAILVEEAPDLTVSLSHEVGRIGLLERENATALNASLRALAAQTISSFGDSLCELAIRCPLYLTQNDGTLVDAEAAKRYPVLTFASGPTNSMRGAAFLSGLQDALVIDIGGTTSDVGALARGFPREASVSATFGGVKTNFRMPDLYAFGLGGGSRVRPDGDDIRVGPDSVGYELAQKALVFGGQTLTATDLAVAAGLAELGEAGHVRSLDPQLVGRGVERMQQLIADALDRMKLTPEPTPVIVVGGGSILVREPIPGASAAVRPEHYEVANAVGAAIAQISGEVDRIFPLNGQTREAILDQARTEAIQRAVTNGAVSDTVQVVDVDDIPVAYLEQSMVRVRVKAVGDLAVGA